MYMQEFLVVKPHLSVSITVDDPCLLPLSPTSTPKGPYTKFAFGLTPSPLVAYVVKGRPQNVKLSP